jgi:tRNA(fMet)-specific endonuclease VapC
MKAFDTDVLTEILLGDLAYVTRAATIPSHEQAIPVVVIEELLRGRLHVVRQAEAGQAKVSLAQAYALFEQTLQDMHQVTVLSYTSQAEGLYQQWRQQRIRIPTHDLRIAAICVAHAATLISRNRRDFAQIPGLQVEFWD